MPASGTERGDAIMQVYDGAKPYTPASRTILQVTAADIIAAHTVILEGLHRSRRIFRQFSEEDPPALEVRQHWQRATGWSIRSTAPKSSSSAMAIHGQYRAD